MFETNSASCGGFKGVSNVYGISLWGLDYGLQMAYSNFSHALIHVGGQDVYYNVSPFSYNRDRTFTEAFFSPSFVSYLNTRYLQYTNFVRSSSDE